MASPDDDVRLAFSHVQMYVHDLESDISVYKELEERLNAFSRDARVQPSSEESKATNVTCDAVMPIDTCRQVWDELGSHRQLSASSECTKTNEIPRTYKRDGCDVVHEGCKGISEDAYNIDPAIGKAEGQTDDDAFQAHNRDLVKQLLCGFGFRITGMYYPHSFGSGAKTRNLLLTTRDTDGVQFIISAVAESNLDRDFIPGSLPGPDEEKHDMSSSDKDKEIYMHFDPANVFEFHEAHCNRQGIAVLAFKVIGGSIDSIYRRYNRLHPQLIPDEYKDGVVVYGTHPMSSSPTSMMKTKIFEVYAYYKNETGKEVDFGTRLRFVEKIDGRYDEDYKKVDFILPGLEPVDATFDETSFPAYCDHWVSNVISRLGFIDTMKDIFGFVPKVDFNAGVVAAGEAQIESTVTGNTSQFITEEKEEALKDQSQIFLPINNALSEVGHVHFFLKEYGQGIQHVASRVKNLAAFVQRANDYRKITGEGFTFLKIPRSYYGTLTASILTSGYPKKREYESLSLTLSLADAIIDACRDNGVLSPDGAVDIVLSRTDIVSMLDHHFLTNDGVGMNLSEEYEENRDVIASIILFSRYTNLYNLLGDNLNESSYMNIVRNQILVDVQGGDLLMQIFTCNILQKSVGDEAPFLEFIERVCSQCTDEDGCPRRIVPGCGGFGIRNFLTLFLSIESSKAMVEVTSLKAVGDLEGSRLAQRKVDIFTNQLNESNPILTEIADAMTSEGEALAALELAQRRGADKQTLDMHRRTFETASSVKAAYNEKLMACSQKYNDLMKSLRQERM